MEIASNREIEEKKIIVLPLIIKDVAMPGFLKGKLYGDFSDEKEYSYKLRLLLRSLGDSAPIINASSEIEKIQKELEEAKKITEHHKSQLNRVIEFNLSTKSEVLREHVISENRSHPEYAPINNVYSFELGESPITIGYVLHALRKSAFKGGHPLEIFTNNS